jgi:Tol biopolymer transport system component
MSPISRSLLRAALLVVAGATVLVAEHAPAEAQYFGRNKVQYRTFDFQVLRTPHFDVYYYPEAEAAAKDAGRMAERWYARLSRVLDHEFEHRQPLVLYASHPHFQQTTTIGSEIGEATGGVTEAFKQRVVMPFAATYADTDHVLGHEIVHAFQYDISGLGRAGGGLEEAARRFNVPLWFIEGMAEYLSLGPVDAHTAMWLRDAALTGQIPTAEQLTFDPRYFPYRWGHAFWAYVGGRWGDRAIGQVLKQVGQGTPMPDAFQRILNTPLEQIFEDWGAAIRRTYLPMLADRREAREEARPLITRAEQGGRVNVGPSLSPDGRQIAFLSELGVMDVELWVADAETGEVTRRLVKGTAFDPHYGSLRFVSSSGTWSPDSRRFAFSALRRARDVVVVLDVARANVLREYVIPNVPEITNPTWSPDGRTIVFTGLEGGINNLYALDVETGASRQITDDRYAYLHAAYSPDGRTIAVATDRGVTDLERLSYGELRLALMDVETGEFTPLPGMERGKNINPSWARDGAGIFFISDRGGIANVYRLTLATGEITQVTNLFTGVSGFTGMSPAISSATGADRLAFAAFERGAFNIYSISGAAELTGTEPREVQLAADGVPLAALLPPAPRPAEAPFNRVLAMLEDDLTGLPPADDPETWEVGPYRARLSLDYLGQPAIGAAVSSGPFSRGGLYGGITGLFSDVLGYHTVFATVQAQGQIDEVGFSTVYLNQQQRWNWGVAAQRVPFIAGGRRQDYDPVDDAVLDQLVRFRLFDSSLSGLAQYPFSRVQRVDFSAGVRRISFDAQIQEFVFNVRRDDDGAATGFDFAGFRERKEDLGTYNLGEASAALVYDNALFGYTSPFAGQRYRFEAAPTVGTLQFTTLTADYRRYLFMRPFTLAMRGLHFGRYGRDEARLQPLFLGYPYLIRGYGYGSVARACSEELGRTPQGGGECAAFDELFGSRVGVANVELRFPLLRQLVLGSSMGLPPLEGFAFLDAGTSWGDVSFNQGQVIRSRPAWQRGAIAAPDERGILTSGGVGARMNLMGYLIVEAAYVNPFDRPQGWHWQFGFQPGF